MNNLYEQLSNRELASLFWLFVVLLASLWKQDIRKSLGQVISSFFAPSLLKIWVLAGIYIGFIVWFLAWRGIWTADYLYSTIVWIISFAFVAMFEASKLSSDKRHFSKILRDTISFTVLLIFIVEMHSFSFIIELIAVPIITALVLMHYMAENKIEFRQIKTVIDCMLFVIAFSYLGFSIWKTYEQFNQICSIDTLRAFLIPILLSLMFLPFIYVLGSYMTYERIFSGLSVWMDSKLLRFAKRKALVNALGNFDYLERWSRYVQFKRPETKAGIQQSFMYVKTILTREKNPPIVSMADGWSPWVAKDFLSDHDLKTRDYREGMDDQWYAESSFRKLGKGYPQNAIMFRVEGTAACVKRLMLTLNVNDMENAHLAQSTFARIALILVERAVTEISDEKLETEWDELQLFERKYNNHKIKLSKDNWGAGSGMGYDLRFTIRTLKQSASTS